MDPKMDGENNGKPYKKWMIWEISPYFRKHACVQNIGEHQNHLQVHHHTDLRFCSLWTKLPFRSASKKRPTPACGRWQRHPCANTDPCCFYWCRHATLSGTHFEVVKSIWLEQLIFFKNRTILALSATCTFAIFYKFCCWGHLHLRNSCIVE